jgi:hypothetical protein
MENTSQKIKLIRDFFGATMTDMKALTSKDRDDLGSAIAKSQELTETEAGFNFVEY